MASRWPRISPNLFAFIGVLLFGVGTQAFCGIRTHQAIHRILGFVGDVISLLRPAHQLSHALDPLPATPWRRFVRGTSFTVTTIYLVGVESAVVALEVFLATEVARADSADEGFRGILSQGLLVAL